MKIETITVHGGQRPDPVSGAIATPITTAKNGAFRALGEPIKITSGRTHNPVREVLEKLFAELEGGEEAVAFSSGVAAINCLFHTLEPGDHVIMGNKLYGGTVRLADMVLGKFLKIDFADPNDTEKLKGLIKRNTKYIFVETPTNPLLDIVNLEAVRDVAQAAGVQVIVDNTFATPCLLRPFDYGAETIIHSTSKYLGDHNDLIGGAIVTRNKELAERLRLYARTLGSIPGPHDAYNAVRGAKTLALRMERHCENAQRVADFLVEHKGVGRVYYPGLPDHPGHAVARRQMKGFGGVVSFEMEGDYRKFANTIASKAPPVYLAESLGGTETLLTHPPTMCHSYLTPEQRAEVGIRENLFRLSVGIEHADDIIERLKTALDAASSWNSVSQLAG